MIRERLIRFADRPHGRDVHQKGSIPIGIGDICFFRDDDSPDVCRIRRGHYRSLVTRQGLGTRFGHYQQVIDITFFQAV